MVCAAGAATGLNVCRAAGSSPEMEATDSRPVVVAAIHSAAPSSGCQLRNVLDHMRVCRSVGPKLWAELGWHVLQNL